MGGGGGGGGRGRDSPNSQVHHVCQYCMVDEADTECARGACETCCIGFEGASAQECAFHVQAAAEHNHDNGDDNVPGDDALLGKRRLEGAARKLLYDALIKYAAEKNVGKILPIHAPMAVFSPFALVAAELKCEGKGLEKVHSKTEAWLTTKERFPEAHEVRSLTDTINGILGSPLTQTHPIQIVDMLMAPVRRYMAIVLVRKSCGMGGLRRFEEKTQMETQVPDEFASGLAAAQAAARAARGGGRFGGGGGRGYGRWQVRQAAGQVANAAGAAAAGQQDAAGASAGAPTAADMASMAANAMAMAAVPQAPVRAGLAAANAARARAAAARAAGGAGGAGSGGVGAPIGSAGAAAGSTTVTAPNAGAGGGSAATT